MRRLAAVLIGVVLFSAAISNPERNRLPTLAAETVTLREVHRAREIGTDWLADARDALLVERPVDAAEGDRSTVFVLDEGGLVLRRVAVEYGRSSPTLIQIVSGVSPGDRIVVSDMRPWDAFDRVQLKTR